MPLILDDGLDDLFGDAPALELASPPSKELLRHVDSMCIGGCYQTLTWSKSGCIARIGFDNRTVILQYLLCDSLNGQWKLSKEYPIEDLPDPQHGGELVHLSWDPTGVELAVIDVFGRISIFGVYITVNRMSLLRRCLVDPEDSLAGVVGMMWLNVDKPAYFYKPAVKSNGQWNFSCSQQRLGGPRSAVPKPAFVAVTRGGKIRVLYQNKDSRLEIKGEVENIRHPTGLITHAAICQDKGSHKDSLLLATYSNDKQLRLYRVSLDFDTMSINLQHLKLISNCSPFSSKDDATLTSKDGTTPQHQLSLLDIIPAGPESRSRGATQPFILGAFLYRSSEFRNGGALHTVLCKWEFQVAKPTLHSAYGQLSSKKTNASSSADLPPEHLLKRLPNISITKTLLSIQHINLGVVLGLLYSDGTVEFRDSMTLDLLPPDSENQISSLSQIGFEFPEGRPCLQAALSPNSCSVISLDKHHNPTISMMQVGSRNVDDFSSEGFYEMVNEAFVTQCSCACMITPSYTDDLLATIQVFTTQYLDSQVQVSLGPSLSNRANFNWRLMSEIYRILGINLDHSMDPQPDQGFKNSWFQRCLSIQASLSFPGSRGRRPTGSTMAWSMLNMRHISMVFRLFSSKKPNTNETELKNPESVTHLLGLVSWTIALNNSIIDEILMLADAVEDHPGGPSSLTADWINQKTAETPLPLLPLLLTSTARAILRFNCRYIRVLGAESSNHRHASTPLAVAYREFELIVSSSPVSVSIAERVLTQVDNAIKAAYQASGITEDERGRAEKDMLVQARIPPVLVDVVKTLLTTTASGLREDVNAAELFFTDVSWLGLSESPSEPGQGGEFEAGRETGLRRKRPVDVLQKIRMRGGRWRRCTRCAALMEDLVPQRGSSVLLVGLARFCVCGSLWMVLEPGERERGE